MRNLAVIDIGSNSVRLLLRAGGAEKQMLETTRLGQGVAERMLQPEPAPTATVRSPASAVNSPTRRTAVQASPRLSLQ